MSGHSKFANIKHKKEKNDAAKGKIFTVIGKEIAVAMLAARGWGNKEIADHLDVSVHTVDAQIKTVMQKLRITQRTDLKKFMLR